MLNQLQDLTINFSPTIPPLPVLKDKTKIDIRYVLIAPYVSVHIYWKTQENELIYEIEEPVLDERQKEFLEKLEKAMIEVININMVVEKTPEAMITYINKTAKLMIDELGMDLSNEDYGKLFYYLYRNFVGLNEIEPLLKDYFIEDIECNGINTPIYIVHRAYKNIKTNISFESMDRITSFVEKLAQRCGKYVSYATPIMDGTLPDGSLDYNEPFIYKEDGIVKVSKIGKFVDKFYSAGGAANTPVSVRDIEVPVFNKETLKIEWKDVSYVYRHKNEGDLYKLKLEFGRAIALTPCHSIFVLTKNGIRAERTENLKNGDYVIIPLRIPENDVAKEFNLAKELAGGRYSEKIVIENIPHELFSEKKLEINKYLDENYKNPHPAYYDLRKKRILPLGLWNIIPEDVLRNCTLKTTSHISIPTFLGVSKELMKLLGYYIAEGWTVEIGAHKRIEFCFNKKEKNLIDDVKNCFRKCFNAEIYIEPENNNAVKLTINSLLLWLVFNDILKVSHYAKMKEIPEIVFNVSKDLRAEFIKAWHAGDYGSTASRKLAQDISFVSLFDGKIAPFYGREKISEIEDRPVKSFEHYTNFFSRNISNFPSMIPVEVLNPLNETHMRLRNKKVSRERLGKLLEEPRYARFADLSKAPVKFLDEWQKREFLCESGLTEKGKELLKEIDFAKKLINSDLGFAKIEKIEKIKSSSEYVYDVSVPGEENFIGGTGGVMCHNSRVNATYTQEISSRGPTFTIRKFTKIPWTPTQMISFRTLSPEMLAYLWMLVQYKCNIMIAGGTASGKTTLLNAISFFIPPEARVVSIEDTRELSLSRENWLPSVARSSVGLGGAGEVSMFNLLKSSFRQNPDYVIVGEVRGEEASVLFQGMASGHSSFSTIHADSVDTLIKRLETPPINLSPTLINTIDAVAIMTHAIVSKQETRKLREVVEIVNVTSEGVAVTNTPFVWNPRDDMFYFKKSSHVFEKISERFGSTVPELEEEFKKRTMLLNELVRRKIFGFKEVQDIVNHYFKDSEGVLKAFEVSL